MLERLDLAVASRPAPVAPPPRMGLPGIRAQRAIFRGCLGAGALVAARGLARYLGPRV